ncbi:MAG: ABC transporter permease [Nanoarchaeota archaeon]|nr:ABC transporter permease [Nanoarchaeota archaeon]MBU1270179.1 ABC transporter permease [Nanoarchaeota archaeon]MBU1604117.1 ABC transporter permease [Nanoarchaeota archaeon]MBU2443367.1 ABC transporter permease [Nanoarchaeota archaeon]
MIGPIYVMWLRQIKRYTRSKSRMIGSFAQPILFLLAFGFGFGPIYQKAGGGDYIQFLAPGIIAMSTLFTAMFTGIEVIWDRRFGFLKETLVAPVPRIQIMIGRTLGGATVAFAHGILVAIIAMFVGFKITNPMNIPLALLFLFLIALLFTALGTAVASKLEDMQAFPLIMNFLIMPIFFLSGALFPLNGLPKAIEIFTKINPLTYGVNGLRATLTGGVQTGLMMNLGVMIVVTIVIGLIGSYMFSKIEI